MKELPSFLITIASLGSMAPAGAAASSILFEWTSATSGNGGGLTASVTSTIRQGFVETQTHNASEPAYVADFASSHSVFFWNVGSSPPGDIDSSFSFAAPLPSGARLIVLDLDVFTVLARASAGRDPRAASVEAKLLGQAWTTWRFTAEKIGKPRGRPTAKAARHPRRSARHPPAPARERDHCHCRERHP
jgi:hypothetical protein